MTDARAPGLRLLEWSLDPERDDLDDLDLAVQVNPSPNITRELLAERQAALPAAVYRQLHLSVTGAGEGLVAPRRSLVGLPRQLRSRARRAGLGRR